jgi:hypothetical protein
MPAKAAKPDTKAIVLTQESIKELFASAPKKRLHYRDIRDALPYVQSAKIIKLLVEMKHKQQIIFDNDLLVSLPG